MNANRDGHRRRERGAVIVEMAIVSVVLFALLFGIITYAYMMSFRQTMTQAAAEGARAGAVTPPGESATDAARNATNDSMSDAGRDCNGGDGLTCTFTETPCDNDASRDCIEVTVSYDYDSHPLLPRFPGFGLIMPDTLSASSVAETTVFEP